MASIVAPDSGPGREAGPSWLLLFGVASLAVHGGLFALLTSTRLQTAAPSRPVDMEIVETRKPPPPPPKVEEKKPEPPKPAPKPVKVAQRLPPPPKNAPPPPPNPTPPPPNQPPPPAKAPPPPINIGLSLSSTTQAGSFAAPVGNTMYGKPSDRAADPNASKAYQAPAAKFVPSYQVTEPPQVVSEVKPPYPEGARKEGLEAQVVLKIAVDEAGAVTKAKVVQGAGHGFDEAALEAIRKYRFKPASFNGEKVATEITYTITFLLD